MAKQKPRDRRLNIILPPITVEKIEDLKRRIGAGSITEVIRRSIALYASFAPEMDQGWHLLLRNPDNGEEIAIRLK